jgi:hypothetical protein
MPRGIFFGLSLLKCLQDPIPDLDCVGQTLQTGGKLREFVVTKVTVCDAGRQNQKIVFNWHVLPVSGVDENALVLFVDSCDLTENYRRVLMLSDDPPDR